MTISDNCKRLLSKLPKDALSAQVGGSAHPKVLRQRIETDEMELGHDFNFGLADSKQAIITSMNSRLFGKVLANSDFPTK